jgi:hypothetical protein
VESAKFDADTTNWIVTLCFTELEAPVTVTVDVPWVAVLAALRVNTLLELVAVGLNVPVTPLGRPEIAKETALPRLLGSTTLMVDVTAVPATRAVRVEADDVRLKLGVGIVSWIAVLLVTAPAVPVMVTVDVPGVAVLAVVSVRTLLEPVADVLNFPVTPVGRPETDSAAGMPRVLALVRLIVDVTAGPLIKVVRVEGEAVRLKLGVGTVS